MNAQLQSLGFIHQHTGGGCHAWELPLSRGLRLVVTDGEGSADVAADRTCAVGVYCDAHSEAIAETIYTTGAEAVATLRLSLK